MFYVCCLDLQEHHYNAQSLGFILVCSRYGHADRQLSHVLLGALCVYVCLCTSQKKISMLRWRLTSEDRCPYILQ